MNKINNIFTYATGELSQDAFLCWLFSFAMKDADDEPVLKECAIDFLKQFIPSLENEKEVWLSEQPKRQYKSIDILLTVNDKYKVIIEDKTYTSEHDDQLEKYLDTVKKDFKDFEPICIYFKTGFQSDYTNVLKSGYRPFNRDDILSTIKKYASKSGNLILNSYYESIYELVSEILKYKTTLVKEWRWAQINGFYEYLEKEIVKDSKYNCNFGYVSNPSGGFYGCWIYDDSTINIDNQECELYIQCESSDGCIRICCKASSRNNEKIYVSKRNSVMWKGDIDLAQKYGFKLSNYHSGKTSTFAYYDVDTSKLNYKELYNEIMKAVNSLKELICEVK